MKFWVSRLPGLCSCGPPGDNPPQIEKAEDFSSALSRLVPSPRYFANPKLLQRANGTNARRTGQRCRTGAHYSVFARAEAAHARLVRTVRSSGRLIARVQ